MSCDEMITPEVVHLLRGKPATENTTVPGDFQKDATLERHGRLYNVNRNQRVSSFLDTESCLHVFELFGICWYLFELATKRTC